MIVATYSPSRHTQYVASARVFAVLEVPHVSTSAMLSANKLLVLSDHVLNIQNATMARDWASKISANIAVALF
jgi:hypothetical protein